MGLFDLPAPLFTAIDGALDFLSPWGRLLVWAAFTGTISMLLYWLCSAQEKVEAAKQRATTARQAMSGYQGTEFGELLPLAKESLLASGKHFLIVLVPAVLSSLPALTLIVWVSNQFAYTLPEAGSTLTLTSTAPLANLTATDPDNNEYSLQWPAADAPLTLYDAANHEILRLPLATTVPVVHKQQWWNKLIGNPNGYLPDDSTVEALSFNFAPIEFVNFGPGWARSWELSYFLLLILVSLGVKLAFKIH